MTPSQLSALRKIVLRPLPSDHPAFTGSNPAFLSSKPGYDSGFNPLWNPLADDVAGQFLRGTLIPTATEFPTPSGWISVFRCRPTPTAGPSSLCSAIHCVDLDNRLNVNAQGNVAQASTGYSNVTNMGLFHRLLRRIPGNELYPGPPGHAAARAKFRTGGG